MKRYDRYAEQMFADIGYNKHDDADDCLTFTKKQGSVTYYIEFHLESFSYETYGFVKGCRVTNPIVNNPIDMTMNNAIQAQLTELNWLSNNALSARK